MRTLKAFVFSLNACSCLPYMSTVRKVVHVSQIKLFLQQFVTTEVCHNSDPGTKQYFAQPNNGTTRMSLSGLKPATPCLMSSPLTMQAHSFRKIGFSTIQLSDTQTDESQQARTVG